MVNELSSGKHKPTFIDEKDTLRDRPGINSVRVALVDGEVWYHDLNMGARFPKYEVQRTNESLYHTFGIAVKFDRKSKLYKVDNCGIGIWVNWSFVKYRNQMQGVYNE
jgi:hypothetical protein